MKFEGNPFFWGFNEQRSIITLAKRANATYNDPRKTVETIPAHPHPTEDDKNATIKTHFFDQDGVVSPNPAFIIGCEPIEPTPYLQSVKSSNEEEEKCEDDETTIITE